jgi:hypothetical protein
MVMSVFVGFATANVRSEAGDGGGRTQHLALVDIESDDDAANGREEMRSADLLFRDGHGAAVGFRLVKNRFVVGFGSFQNHLGKDLRSGKRLCAVQGRLGQREAGLIFLKRLARLGESRFEKPEVHGGERLIHLNAIAFLHAESGDETLRVVLDVHGAVRLDRSRCSDGGEEVARVHLDDGQLEVRSALRPVAERTERHEGEKHHRGKRPQTLRWKFPAHVFRGWSVRRSSSMSRN